MVENHPYFLMDDFDGFSNGFSILVDQMNDFLVDDFDPMDWKPHKNDGNHQLCHPAFQRHLINHLAAPQERRRGAKELGPAPQETDARGATHLMTSRLEMCVVYLCT